MELSVVEMRMTLGTSEHSCCSEINIAHPPCHALGLSTKHNNYDQDKQSPDFTMSDV
jgi:hypothetical protein